MRGRGRFHTIGTCYRRDRRAFHQCVEIKRALVAHEIPSKQLVKAMVWM